MKPVALASDVLHQALGDSFDYYYEQLKTASNPLIIDLGRQSIQSSLLPLRTLQALDLQITVASDRPQKTLGYFDTISSSDVTSVANDIGANKLINLEGGILNKSDIIVPVITVKDEQPIKELLEHNDIRNTTKNIDRLTGVVDFLLNDTESSAVFTKPSSLIRELFTHEGDGTLVRSGDAIDSFYTLNDVNQNQLRNIIENAFGGRKLIQDYFDKLPNDTQTLITAQRYDGVAIITPRGLNNPVAYLDKIAVSKMAQSAGVGKELIDKAIDMHPDGLYWRTKITNARSLNWYIEVADRYSINEDWAIFGVNIEDDKIFEECIKHALVKDVSI